MKLYEKINTKDLLAQSLYVLMEDIKFDKITIKNICDKAGVIRGTFYNHFYDKHEALEYLTYKILFEEDENVQSNVDYEELFKSIILQIEEEKEFFIKCFKIKGQNSFNEMLLSAIKKIFNDYIDARGIVFSDSIIERDFFVNIYTNQIVNIIEMWLTEHPSYQANKIIKIFILIYSKNIKTIFNELENNGI